MKVKVLSFAGLFTGAVTAQYGYDDTPPSYDDSSTLPSYAGQATATSLDDAYVSHAPEDVPVYGAPSVTATTTAGRPQVTQYAYASGKQTVQACPVAGGSSYDCTQAVYDGKGAVITVVVINISITVEYGEYKTITITKTDKPTYTPKPLPATLSTLPPGNATVIPYSILPVVPTTIVVSTESPYYPQPTGYSHLSSQASKPGTAYTKIPIATIVGTAAPSYPTHHVHVGKHNTFSPNYIKANAGETVRFVFYPRNHTVTSCDFEKPCQWNGEYDSGYKPTWSQNSTVYADYPVTNASAPAWFFSSQKGECGKGMVFAINPKSPNQYKDFYDRAKSGNGGSGPVYVPTDVPTGPGPVVQQPASTNIVNPPYETPPTIPVSAGAPAQGPPSPTDVSAGPVPVVQIPTSTNVVEPTQGPLNPTFPPKLEPTTSTFISTVLYTDTVLDSTYLTISTCTETVSQDATALPTKIATQNPAGGAAPTYGSGQTITITEVRTYPGGETETATYVDDSPPVSATESYIPSVITKPYYTEASTTYIETVTALPPPISSGNPGPGQGYHTRTVTNSQGQVTVTTYRSGGVHPPYPTGTGGHPPHFPSGTGPVTYPNTTAVITSNTRSGTVTLPTTSPVISRTSGNTSSNTSTLSNSKTSTSTNPTTSHTSTDTSLPLKTSSPTASTPSTTLTPTTHISTSTPTQAPIPTTIGPGPYGHYSYGALTDQAAAPTPKVKARDDPTTVPLLHLRQRRSWNPFRGPDSTTTVDSEIED